MNSESPCRSWRSSEASWQWSPDENCFFVNINPWMTLITWIEASENPIRMIFLNDSLLYRPYHFIILLIPFFNLDWPWIPFQKLWFRFLQSPSLSSKACCKSQHHHRLYCLRCRVYNRYYHYHRRINIVIIEIDIIISILIIIKTIIIIVNFVVSAIIIIFFLLL